MVLRRMAGNEKGATAIEYSLIAMMISVACIAGMQAIGAQSSTGWHGVWDNTKEILGY